MRFIKNHKFTSLAIVIFIALVFITYYLYNIFFTNSSKPEYGNRLDGIENVEIKDDELKKIETSVSENKSVKSVTTNISGKTLDIVITVDDSVLLKDAKAIGDKSFSTLSEKQIDFYSVQVFIKKDSAEQNNFPIIGYKQRGTKTLVWTKDRSVTKADESK